MPSETSVIDSLLSDKERKLFKSYRRGGIPWKIVLKFYIGVVVTSIVVQYAALSVDWPWLSILDTALLLVLVGALLMAGRSLTLAGCGIIAKYEDFIQELARRQSSDELGAA